MPSFSHLKCPYERHIRILFLKLYAVMLCCILLSCVVLYYKIPLWEITLKISYFEKNGVPFILTLIYDDKYLRVFKIPKKNEYKLRILHAEKK